MRKSLYLFLFITLFFFSCKKKENVIKQSGVISDVIVNHNMALTLGYSTDTVYSFHCANTLTPNGDGTNDEFAPVVFGDVKSYHFEVRSKYNTIIFETNDQMKKWDGKQEGTYAIVHEGVYKYYIEVKTGTPEMLHKYAGGVMIVR